MSETKTIVQLSHPDITQPFRLELDPAAIQDLARFLRPGTEVSTSLSFVVEEDEEKSKPRAKKSVEAKSRKREDEPIDMTGAEISTILRALTSEGQLVGEIAEKSGIEKRRAAAILRQAVAGHAAIQTGKGRGTRYAIREGGKEGQGQAA